MLLKLLSSSVGIQVTSGIFGLLLVRLLSKDDYAVYTINAAAWGLVTVLSKGGIHLGFTKLLGETWPDRKRAEDLILCANKERIKLSRITIPLICAYFIWMLVEVNTSGVDIAILTLLLIITFYFDLHSKFEEIFLQFAGKANSIQIIDLWISSSKILATIGLYAANYLFAICIVGFVTLTAAYRARSIQKLAGPERELQASFVVPSDRTTIREVASRQLPLEIFHCAQAQVIMTIIALKSTPDTMADWGAIGRIAQLLAPIGTIVLVYLVPRFAQTKHRVFTKYGQYCATVAAVCSCLPISIALFPNVFLWLLGPSYQHLGTAVSIAALTAAAQSISGAAWQLAAHRGWNRFSILQIPLFVGWSILFFLIADLTNLEHLLWFQLGYPIAVVITTVLDIVDATRKAKKQ